MQEVKKRVLQNNKLTPVLLGINSEGVMRMDPKSKEASPSPAVQYTVMSGL